ncbi:Protein RFT1-like [Oopsacas minuta]|uniref:Man(5)GlcNAc(2)-PP-dolichol translocation protein RFT1 n=1 Tax=Oopsacas minuta TaxID=111878 RepID=A0AAV7JTR6_9METZ|nr:Protein RFT1-like [Oopsacas minuta]
MSRESINNSALDSATHLASAMVLLSVSVRAGTFLLNAILLRFITPELLGLVQVRLLLLLYTIHTVSKDPYHKVFLNKQVWSRHSVSHVISSLWSIVVIGIFFSILFSFIWSSPLLMEQPDRRDYYPAVLLYGLSAICIVMTEPFVILVRYGGYTRLEVTAEAVAFLLQCIITILFVLSFPDWGLLSFSIPQLIYSLIKMILFVGYFSQIRDFSHLPVDTFRECFPPLLPPLSFPLLQEIRSFITYTVLKQLLTNGEQYVMTIFATLSFAQQGIFSVVHNLGSMAARFIFKPLEDSFAVYFTKSLPRGKDPQTINGHELLTSKDILLKLFRFVVIIGLIFTTFSPAYSHLLLHLYGGRMLSDSEAPFLLKCYSVYVLLLALNGISECFCFSVMGQQQLHTYNRYMIVYSIIYVLLAILCTNSIGVLGVLMANCINMIARVMYSFLFIENYFNRSGTVIGKISPSPVVLVSLFFTFIITNFSHQQFFSLELIPQVLHVAIGGVCLLVNAAIICFSDPCCSTKDMEVRILVLIILLYCLYCLYSTTAKLSFIPVEDFYEEELGTDLNISCLYNGGVDSRVDWIEGSVVISSYHLNLINISLGHHLILCRYTPDTGSIQTKQLTVNIYVSTQLELYPSLSNCSYSTQLTNSTPYYVYCLGYGNPSPDLEWREDSNAISSIQGSSLNLPEQSYDSIAAIDLKQFSSGLHHLSCYGFNGYISHEVFLNLTVDSSNPLLIFPDHNSTHNNTLEYLLTDSYTDFYINCSLKLFSISPDDNWAGLTPVWTLFNDSDKLSNLSSILLSNNTIGDICCVLLARDNFTIIQKVHVSFVNTQTPSLATSSTYPTSSTHSTTLASTTNYTVNTTTTGVTFRSTPMTSTSTIPLTTVSASDNSIQLSSLVLAVIIAVLFTLLCISVLILLSLSLLLVYNFVSKRTRIRRKKRCSRVMYLDVMNDSYPLPLQRRDSNQYSGNTLPDNDTSGGVTRGLGVRVPIYERIPDHVIPSESADIVVHNVTPPNIPQTRDVV